MSNRLKKGMDNLKETDSQSTNQIESENAATEIPVKYQVEIDAKNNTLHTTKNNIESNIFSSILDNITVKENTGGNFTFYLSVDVANQIAKVAKQKKISKSKLVDNILRQVLLGE